MPRMKKAMKKAGKHAKELERIAAKSRVKKRKKPAKKETLVDKVARKLLEIYYQPKKKFTPTGKKGVAGGLRQAGVSEKKIKQLRD